MASVNKVILVGHLGRDPEVRYVGDEAVCNFSIATTEKWKSKSGEPMEATEWHRISAWGRLAEIVGEYLRKGSLVYIEGKLQTRKYNDKDGVEKSSTEVRMSDMKMLGGRPDSQGQGSAPAQRQAPPAGQRQQPPARRPAPAGGSGFDDMDDDIPF